MIDRDFWKQRKVLITGHTGFKGSWLSLLLQSAEARTFGYALHPPTNPSLFNDARVADGMTSIEGDVRDLGHLASVMSEHRPEVVIHMAAQPIVRQSYVDPVGTFGTNVMGTVNVLEAARQTTSVRAVVVVTSDKCYANKDWVWRYREEDPLGGHDPYSATKACAELVAAAYRDSFLAPYHIGLATVRAGNVVGGGDWAADRLVPDTVRALMQNQSVQIRNPGAVRPWQHVLEPLHGYLMVAEALFGKKQHAAGAWNFGPDESGALPVSWLVSNMVDRWGGACDWTINTASHPHEDKFLTLDSSKSRVLLKWTPLLSFHETLDWTVEWYKGYAGGEDARILTLRQIERYETESATRANGETSAYSLFRRSKQ
jgi:CDP-glucose 4,6-dehydratase